MWNKVINVSEFSMSDSDWRESPQLEDEFVEIKD